MSTLELMATEASSRRGTLRRLWQRLPQATRRQILFDVSRFIAPLPDARPRGGFPVAIAGMFSTASGIGEGARLAYTALEAAGYAPTAFDLSPAFGHVEFSDDVRRRDARTGRRHFDRASQRPVSAARAVGARPRAREGAPHHRLLGLGIAASAARLAAELPLRARDLGALEISPATPSRRRPTSRCMSCIIRCRRWR